MAHGTGAPASQGPALDRADSIKEKGRLRALMGWVKWRSSQPARRFIHPGALLRKLVSPQELLEALVSTAAC
jgi:hypothetical protein